MEVWGGSRSPGFGKNIETDMIKGKKRGARPNWKTHDDRTLYREDSEAEGGINRPVESLSSPSSKKSNQKSRYVADIRKILISSEGGGSKENTHFSQKHNSSSQSMDWRQKLQEFRAPKSEEKPIKMPRITEQRMESEPR